MADFCNQCSESLFGNPGDFKGVTSKEAWEKQTAVVVLCEGCGPIQVDPDGNCVSEDCLEYGHSHQVAKLYYEAHITIEPVFDTQLKVVEAICHKHKFRLADLFMQKRKNDTPERSKFDTFATTRSKNYADIRGRTEKCVRQLQEYGFNVWRYKIEDTLLDVRLKDE